MIGIKTIELNRAEGLIFECGNPIVADSWDAADEALAKMSHSAPRNGASNKIDFVLTFEDGETYSGTYYLQTMSYAGYPNIKGHVQRFVNQALTMNHLKDLFTDFVNNYDVGVEV